MEAGTQLYYIQKFRNFSNKHKKRERKQRKRHADRFFRSRLQKYNYFYTKFNRLTVLKQKKMTHNLNLSHPTPKYKFAIKNLELDYLDPLPLSSLIKISKKF